MFTAASNAYITQRDASRKLYFTAVGCLCHPEAGLVAKTDPEALPILEQAAESGLKFADLSEEEREAFRQRAVASTRVVETSPGDYAFEQPDRPPRRRFPSRTWTGFAARCGVVFAAAVAAALLGDWLARIAIG